MTYGAGGIMWIVNRNGSRSLNVLLFFNSNEQQNDEDYSHNQQSEAGKNATHTRMTIGIDKCVCFEVIVVIGAVGHGR